MTGEDELPDDGDRGDGEPIVLRNEFTEVVVRRVRTRNGERLEVASPKTGHAIRLDAMALEGLSWQDPEAISAFHETPFGTDGGAE